MCNEILQFRSTTLIKKPLKQPDDHVRKQDNDESHSQARSQRALAVRQDIKHLRQLRGTRKYISRLVSDFSGTSYIHISRLESDWLYRYIIYIHQQTCVWLYRYTSLSLSLTLHAGNIKFGFDFKDISLNMGLIWQLRHQI